MKIKLENCPEQIYDWIQLIFGVRQKYKADNKKDLLFREKSFISFDDPFKEIIDEQVLSEVDWGLIPLQTLYECNNLKMNKTK